MFRSIVVIAMLAAGDAALISKPMMTPKTELPPRALALQESNVLALRGGGMIDQSMWMKAFSVFMGLYGVGFVAAPGMVIEQNFDTPYDKYHIFISRMAGAFMLTVLYTWSKMDVSAAFPIAYVMGIITAILGPLNAELTLETKPAHKAAFLMIPFIITGAMAF